MDKLVTLVGWVLGAQVAVKAIKLILAVTVIVVAYNMATDAVDYLVGWLSGLAEPEVNGKVVPLVGMMAWMGFFDALAILLGAHVAVLTIRLVMRGLEWL